MNPIAMGFFLLLFFGLPWAAEFPEVVVELQNGLRQNVLLLGMEQDSVRLGGEINGKATEVHIPKSRLHSIVTLPDSLPIDLATGRVARKDSLMQQIPPESQTADPSETTEAVIEPPPPHDWMGHLVVLPPEISENDSTLSAGIQAMILQNLHDHNSIPAIGTRLKDFRDIPSADSLMRFLKSIKALGFLGSQWRQQGDSLHAQFRVWWADSVGKPHGSSAKARKAPWSQWILSPGPWVALDKTMGWDVRSRSTSPRAKLLVETEPEGAIISLNGAPPSCKSPCSMQINTDSVHRAQIWASWRVEDRLWAGKSTVPIHAGDSLHALIRMQPQTSTLQIFTQPSGAEVYAADQEWSPALRPQGHTPYVTENLDPGEKRWLIRMIGFQDTLLSVVPDPTGATQININLSPLQTPEEIATQHLRIRAQQRNFWGKALMASSTGPLLAGALLCWLAQTDYQRAQDLKEELEMPSSGTGASYLETVQENKDAVDRGDTKIAVGATLLGLGGLMLTAGFIIWF